MKKERESNLELFRIITMLLIVAHHYVVNSGLLAEGGPVYSDLMSSHSLFLLIMGMGGKTGINCFVLITGFFMCRSDISLKKYMKLISEVLFYRIIIGSVFWITGYEQFSMTECIKTILPVTEISDGFTGAFLIFYLFIPFINIIIKNMNEKQHVLLIALCVFTYTVFGTFSRITFNYVSWFTVLYFISSYICLYPKKIFSEKKIWTAAMFCSVLLSVCSVAVMTYVKYKYNKGYPYYFVQDSNTFLALVTGLSCFMFFKNIKVKHSKVINAFGASTFGVLLIHANSDAMRRWLWYDVLNNTGVYSKSWMYLHAAASVIGVFVICSMIDMIRINFLEKAFFKLYGEKIDNFQDKLSKKADVIFGSDCKTDKLQ